MSNPESQPLPPPEGIQFPAPNPSAGNWVSDSDVLIPAEIAPVVQRDLGETAIQTGIEISPSAQVGVIDKQFSVHRSDGTVEEGWSIRSAFWRDERGTYRVTIEKEDPDANDGTLMVKDVPAGEFLRWQEKSEEGSIEPNHEVGNLQVNFDVDEIKVGSSSFKVRRSDGSVETGWVVSSLTPDDMRGKTYADIMKIDPVTGETLTKRVSTDTLKKWQLGSESQPEQLEPVSGLIDKVPKSAEEVEQLRIENEVRVNRQKLELNAPRIAELKAKMDAIKEEVGEEQSLLLWQYGSYNSQRQDSASKGDIDNDNYFRKISEDVIGKMKPGTSKYKDEYWAVLTEKTALEFPK